MIAAMGSISASHKMRAGTSTIRLLAWLTLPAGMLLISLFLLVESFQIPFVALTRDAAIAYTRDAPYYSGSISNFGGIIWSIGAAVSLFAAWMLRRMGPAHAQMSGFLLTYGVLTLVLLFDDLFMIHETITLLTGRSQKLTLLIQGLITGWLIVRYHRPILQSRWSILAVAMLFFSGSLLIDFDLIVLSDRFHHLFEDGSKFIGLVIWSGYGVITSASALHVAINHAPVVQLAAAEPSPSHARDTASAPGE